MPDENIPGQMTIDECIADAESESPARRLLHEELSTLQRVQTSLRAQDAAERYQRYREARTHLSYPEWAISEPQGSSHTEDTPCSDRNAPNPCRCNARDPRDDFKLVLVDLRALCNMLAGRSALIGAEITSLHTNLENTLARVQKLFDNHEQSK